jgi:cysteine desulfurase
MVYMDYHATTPVDPAVVQAMLPFFTEHFGNAASRQYRLGWDANAAVERARGEVAALIGADAKEIVWTSGATEANNLALKGLLEVSVPGRDHIVTVATEHKSVLDTCRHLQRRGCRVTTLPVEPDGSVDLEGLRAAVTDRTAVVSVMAANNEIGVLAPLAAIAAVAHDQGALLHTDAVQAAGKVPVDVHAAGVDLASLTAHKVYGPKGIGALYVRRRQPRVSLAPLIDGGGHERGMRSGTLNVPGIVGFGAAAALARREMASEAARLLGLRTRLLAHLTAGLPDLVVNGALAARLPGNLNVSFPGVDGETLLLALCDEVAISSGAACTAAEPSHVLRALGRPTELALASLRFGLGRWTTEAEIDAVAARVVDTVRRSRGCTGVTPWPRSDRGVGAGA